MGSFPCADCGQTFNDAQARNRHRWSQHTNIPPISAGGKQYAVEREEDGTVRCPVHQCGRSYKSREAFAKHAKIVHGSGSKPATPSSGPTVSSSQELSFGPSSNWKMLEPSADFREGLGPGVTSISCKTGFLEVASSHRPGPTLSSSQELSFDPNCQMLEPSPDSAKGPEAPGENSSRGPVGQVEAVESERNAGKLIGRAFGWLDLLASLLGVATEKPARAREEVLDAKELTAQVSEVVADAVMKKLAGIGLTVENIKKLEILAEMVPIDTPAIVLPGVSLERTASTESKRQSSGSSFPRRDEPLPSKIYQAATPSSSEKPHIFETLPDSYTSTFPSSNQRKRVTTEEPTRVTKRGRHGEVPREQYVISSAELHA